MHKKGLDKLFSDFYIFLYRFYYGNFFYFFNIFPIKKDKIVVSNFYGKGYGDNPKYIVEELIKNYPNLYNIVWMVKDEGRDSNFPKEIKLVKYHSFAALYHLATSKIWIDNVRKVFYPPKRKNQIYIQTWHGCISLKKIEHDAIATLGYRYKKLSFYDNKMTDIMISNSNICSKMYRRAFLYNKKILEFGTPRCDIFFKKNEQDNLIKKYFNLPMDCKIVLYAPTFRKDYSLTPYSINFENLINTLDEKENKNWYILIRLHPNMSNMASTIQYSNRIINASQYDDMYQLLKYSDMLITDYSSTMFEYMITEKPVILYVTDRKEYVSDRNFYFDFEQLPFIIVENNEQLNSSIVNFNLKEYTENISNFKKKYNIVENGYASQKIVDYIQKQI